MGIEYEEILKDDLLRSASIMFEGEPVVEFELYKYHYVVDWDSRVGQQDFFAAVKNLDIAHDAPSIIQSQEKYPSKTEVKLEEALALEDEVLFFAFDTEEYGMTWYKQKSRNARIEFSSEKKKVKDLVYLLNKTSEGLGDLVVEDVNEVLDQYKE